MEKIITLATTSPSRIKAFSMSGIPFETFGSNVNENFEGRSNEPGNLVFQLAKLKAEAVAKRLDNSPRIIIGFDSVGWFNYKILEKPKSREEAFARLDDISGSEFNFFTGIYMIDIRSDGRRIFNDNLERTIVKMRYYSEPEIEKYLDQDPNFLTYALGFNPLDTHASTFVEWIWGCYNNLLYGIPLAKVIEMIRRTGFKIVVEKEKNNVRGN